jgi:N-acetylmuramoyl-L-alanine amidase
MPTVASDKGHGIGCPGKETPVFETGAMKGKRMQEEEFNDAVGYYLDAELKRHGIKVVDVTPEKSDTPLSVRVKRANDAKADIYVSIHANAVTGKWGTAGGIETFCYPKSANSKRLATLVHKNLMKGTAMQDRGVKDGSQLFVIKNSNMPAILAECGFMDNLREAVLLLSDAYRRECAHEILLGILEYFGMKYKAPSAPVAPAPKPAPKPIVTAPIVLKKGVDNKGEVSKLQNSLDFLGYELTPDGIFGDATDSAVRKFQKENKLAVDGIVGKDTLAKIAELVSKKKQALVKPTPPKKEEENVLYKVQAGAFRERTGADKLVSDLKKAGFPATIITEK